MAGYIGANVGTVTANAADIKGDISSTDTSPDLTLKNTTQEDTDGGRESTITFKGEQSGGEETTLAQIESAHDGTADDEKGDLVFKTNDGNDGASPTERLRLDSAGDMLLSSPDPSFTITNTTHEDTDGGRESTIVFKGEQSGGELSTLAEIEASHDGTADDEKGDLIFKTNDGSDGASPTERLRIDSNGSIIPSTLGTSNVKLGLNAGNNIASGGNYNTVIGEEAGNDITTGDNNTLIGTFSGDAITTSSGNTAVGSYTMTSMTDGGDNVAVGTSALDVDTKGSNSVAIGRNALGAQNFTSATNAFNVAVGHSAGVSNTTGTYNTFIGPQSGFNMTTGSQNTFIGQYDGNNGSLDLRADSNNIVISDGDGYVRAHYGHPAGGTKFWNFYNNQNQWTMGIKGNTSSPYGCLVEYTGAAPNGSANDFFMGHDTVGVKFQVNSNGNVKNLNNSYGATSDIKLKENIADSGSQWDDIKAVKVKKYSMKIDESDTANRIGVIAQDLEAAGMNGLVDESPDIDPNTKEPLETTTKTVKYSILYMKAVKALQEAMTRIETLETKVAELEAE